MIEIEGIPRFKQVTITNTMTDYKIKWSLPTSTTWWENSYSLRFSMHGLIGT